LRHQQHIFYPCQHTQLHFSSHPQAEEESAQQIMCQSNSTISKPQRYRNIEKIKIISMWQLYLDHPLFVCKLFVDINCIYTTKLENSDITCSSKSIISHFSACKHFNFHLNWKKRLPIRQHVHPIDETSLLKLCISFLLFSLSGILKIE
jgi:hypothetical protein